MTVRVALDAMGGDRAPAEVVAGALMAAGGLGVELLLVGDEAAIRTELKGATHTPHLQVVHTPDAIGMHEHAAEAVRARPAASINVGLRLLREGRADAFVTAGNTGATMAASLLTLGRIRGISRPALGTVFPGASGPIILLDVGANADCRPMQLVQFAHMGAGYMRRMFGMERPRVGLLSIGEEDSKGNELTIEAHALLRASPLNFIGNLEGKDLTKGLADVAVMDGFTGNVVLKTAEGMAELLFTELRKAVELTPWNRAAGLVLMGELRKVRRRLDYAEYGGAPLLGVDGAVIIGHGRSNARAIFNAVRAARDTVEKGVIEAMRDVAREIPVRGRQAAAPRASLEGENEELPGGGC